MQIAPPPPRSGPVPGRAHRASVRAEPVDVRSPAASTANALSISVGSRCSSSSPRVELPVSPWILRAVAHPPDQPRALHGGEHLQSPDPGQSSGPSRRARCAGSARSGVRLARVGESDRSYGDFRHIYVLMCNAAGPEDPRMDRVYPAPSDAEGERARRTLVLLRVMPFGHAQLFDWWFDDLAPDGTHVDCFCNSWTRRRSSSVPTAASSTPETGATPSARRRPLRCGAPCPVGTTGCASEASPAVGPSTRRAASRTWRSELRAPDSCHGLDDA